MRLPGHTGLEVEDHLARSAGAHEIESTDSWTFGRRSGCAREHCPEVPIRGLTDRRRSNRPAPCEPDLEEPRIRCRQAVPAPEPLNLDPPFQVAHDRWTRTCTALFSRAVVANACRSPWIVGYMRPSRSQSRRNRRGSAADRQRAPVRSRCRPTRPPESIRQRSSLSTIFALAWYCPFRQEALTEVFDLSVLVGQQSVVVVAATEVVTGTGRGKPHEY